MVQFAAILAMLGILSLLIIVHEMGHFLVARFFGFQTPVFGFGLPFFGPYWVLGKRWGTEFRLHALLLGGYVAIPELGDETQVDEDFGVALKPFRKFPIWQRALVAFAGVGFNILFAYLIMFTMLSTLGQPIQPTVVYSLIKENPIATEAGIKSGDQVIAINGLRVTSPDEAVHILTSRKSQQVNINLIREGKPVELAMTTNENGKVGMALVSKGKVVYEKVEKGFVGVCGLSAVKLWNITSTMVEATGQFFVGLFHPGQPTEHGKQPAPGLQDMHGVLAVIKIGADIAQQDWCQLFLFTVLISMDLAIINLVPWPALDGGHLAFMAIEAIRGKPLAEKPQAEIMRWGVITLLALMAIVMFNDVTALIEGKLSLKPKSNNSEKQANPEHRTNQNQALPEGNKP